MSAFHFVDFGHHPIGSLCYMARYSLGPPLRSGLPPYGRHHFAALMQRNFTHLRPNEMHPRL